MELSFIEEVHSFSTGRFLILAEVQTQRNIDCDEVNGELNPLPIPQYDNRIFLTD